MSTKKPTGPQVVTYQSPAGHRLNLTPDQAAELTAWNAWPRDPSGEEYCSVSHGLHAGTPSMSGIEVARLCCAAQRGGAA